MAKETDRSVAERVVKAWCETDLEMAWEEPYGWNSGAKKMIEAITQALASKDVPEGHIRDDKQVDYKVRFRTPAGSPSPVDNSAPCVQFYCDSARKATDELTKGKERGGE